MQTEMIIATISRSKDYCPNSPEDSNDFWLARLPDNRKSKSIRAFREAWQRWQSLPMKQLRLPALSDWQRLGDTPYYVHFLPKLGKLSHALRQRYDGAANSTHNPRRTRPSASSAPAFISSRRRAPSTTSSAGSRSATAVAIRPLSPDSTDCLKPTKAPASTPFSIRPTSGCPMESRRSGSLNCAAIAMSSAHPALKSCRSFSGAPTKKATAATSTATPNKPSPRSAKQSRATIPGHRIAGAYSPPFRPLTPAEETEIVDRINAAQPDILWVALGMPKQDIWIHERLATLNVPVAIGVGAAFAFVAGTVPRCPEWMGRAGFEWVYRFLKEPAQTLASRPARRPTLHLLCRHGFHAQS